MKREILLMLLIVCFVGMGISDCYASKTILVRADRVYQNTNDPVSLEATNKAVTAASSYFAKAGFRTLNNEARTTLSMELENFGEIDLDDENGAKIAVFLRKNHIDVYARMMLSYQKTKTKLTVSADTEMYNLTTNRIIASVSAGSEEYISGNNIAAALNGAARKVGYRAAKLLVNELANNPDLLKQLQSFEYILTFNGFSVDENDQIIEGIESIVHEDNILPPQNTSGFLEVTITTDKKLRKITRKIKTKITETGLNVVKTMSDGSKVVFKKEGEGFGIGEIEIN